MYEPKTIVLAIDRLSLQNKTGSTARKHPFCNTGRMSGGFVPNSVVFATK